MERQRICVREKEACQMLGIGRALLSKTIPFSYVGTAKLYRLSDIEKYLDEHRVSIVPEAVK